MNKTPSETIYSNGEVIIPMADVQHIEKKYYSHDMISPPNIKKGDLMGILVITRHTRWDTDNDCWANNIWIGRDKAEGFIRDWCYFRYEIDGIKELKEG